MKRNSIKQQGKGFFSDLFNPGGARRRRASKVRAAMSDLKRDMLLQRQRIVRTAVKQAKAEGRRMGLRECRATHARSSAYGNSQQYSQQYPLQYPRPPTQAQTQPRAQQIR